MHSRLTLPCPPTAQPPPQGSGGGGTRVITTNEDNYKGRAAGLAVGLFFAGVIIAGLATWLVSGKARGWGGVEIRAVGVGWVGVADRQGRSSVGVRQQRGCGRGAGDARCLPSHTSFAAILDGFCAAKLPLGTCLFECVRVELMDARSPPTYPAGHAEEERDVEVLPI